MTTSPSVAELTRELDAARERLARIEALVEQYEGLPGNGQVATSLLIGLRRAIDGATP